MSRTNNCHSMVFHELLNVKFQYGDADELPFENNVFDAVINRHVFWTMSDPEKAAAEWARVLKPGGKLVIIDGDWNHFSPWKMIAETVSFKDPRAHGLLDNLKYGYYQSVVVTTVK